MSNHSRGVAPRSGQHIQNASTFVTQHNQRSQAQPFQNPIRLGPLNLLLDKRGSTDEKPGHLWRASGSSADCRNSSAPTGPAGVKILPPPALVNAQVTAFQASVIAASALPPVTKVSRFCSRRTVTIPCWRRYSQLLPAIRWCFVREGKLAVDHSHLKRVPLVGEETTDLLPGRNRIFIEFDPLFDPQGSSSSAPADRHLFQPLPP